MDVGVIDYVIIERGTKTTTKNETNVTCLGRENSRRRYKLSPSFDQRRGLGGRSYIEGGGRTRNWFLITKHVSLLPRNYTLDSIIEIKPSSPQ